MNNRLSFENMQMLNGISALCPDSNKFLQRDVLKPFALKMKAALSSSFNEIQVLKSMLKDTVRGYAHDDLYSMDAHTHTLYTLTRETE